MLMCVRDISSNVGLTAILLRSAWSVEPFPGYADSAPTKSAISSYPLPVSCPVVSYLPFCSVLITNMNRWKGQSMAIVGMIAYSAVGLKEPGRRICGVTLTSCFRVQFVSISFRKLGSILIQNNLQLLTQHLLPSTINCVMDTAISIIMYDTPKFCRAVHVLRNGGTLEKNLRGGGDHG